MRQARRLPPKVAEHARAFAAAGRTPVPARPASTVVLVRDGAHGIDIYVHQRHRSMPFAGGLVAFPGGGVDPSDVEPDRTIDARMWARRLRATEPAASGFVKAALRETNEETGIRLTPADLRPWAHWVTPRFESRRYDTWFFVAALPAGEQPRDVSGEASAVTWITPGEAIARAERGEWVMLPPTWAVLEDLAGYTSVADLPPGRDQIETVIPGWIEDGDAVLALLPGDPRYPGDDPGE